jgi:methylated-DNA-[protein]-cysteine S-methyltransferase
MTHTFTAEDVYELTSRIPKGRVSTYGSIAAALNAPGASRAIGQILKANPRPIIVPCHRVVKSDGRIGGYGGSKGYPKKIRLLKSEGLRVKDSKILEMDKVLFKNFSRTKSR